MRIKLEGYRCMPAPHALYSKMLAERTASRNVLVLFYFIYCTVFHNYHSSAMTSCTPEIIISYVMNAAV